MNINIEYWYKKFGDRFNITYAILLVLAGLHYEKKITDNKLKGQLSALRKGTLQKTKGTHHCDITDRWYDHESAYDVFKDCIVYKNVKVIPFDEFINYINLFENKGYNHALNIFGTEYIYKMLNSWNPEWQNTNFSDLIDFHIPNITYTNNRYTCYECGNQHGEYSNNEKENVETISKWLHNKKKGNLDKIPFHLISNKSFSF